MTHYIFNLSLYTTLLEKYPTFFSKNLADFNEASLHEATLKLHKYAWTIFRLSISLVDCKHHLSEIPFSSLVGFSLQGK